MKVVLASKNKHKLVEISQITEKFGMELVLQSELGVDIDVEETGTTFEENSFLKAEAVMKATGLPALADDSGICVDALNGEPGVYSARYGFDDTLDDWGRLELLLKNTDHVPDGQRQAKFVAVITMVTPEGQTIQARGEIHGELLRAPVGENGFGYDPIFYYPPYGKSTAEMRIYNEGSIGKQKQAQAGGDQPDHREIRHGAGAAVGAGRGYRRGGDRHHL